jgi:hypothetical protein
MSPFYLEKCDVTTQVTPTMASLNRKDMPDHCGITRPILTLEMTTTSPSGRLALGVKTELIRMDSSETVFVTVFFPDSESERRSPRQRNY